MYNSLVYKKKYKAFSKYKKKWFPNSRTKDPKYIAWRKAVFARDMYMCQYPGCKTKGIIEAHHIKKWSDHRDLRTSVHNGITLCHDCHIKITGNEQHYEDTFFSILHRKSKGQKYDGIRSVAASKKKKPRSCKHNRRYKRKKSMGF